MELNHRGTRPATSGGITPPTGDAPTSGPIVEVRDHIWGNAPRYYLDTPVYRPRSQIRTNESQPLILLGGDKLCVKDETIRERIAAVGKLVDQPPEWFTNKHGIQAWDNSAHDNEVIRWNPEFMGDEGLESGVIWGCSLLEDMDHGVFGGQIKQTDFDGDKI